MRSNNKIRFIGGELDGELVPSNFRGRREIFNEKYEPLLTLSEFPLDAKEAGPNRAQEKYGLEEFRYRDLNYIMYFYKGMM